MSPEMLTPKLLRAGDEQAARGDWTAAVASWRAAARAGAEAEASARLHDFMHLAHTQASSGRRAGVPREAFAPLWLMIGAGVLATGAFYAAFQGTGSAGVVLTWIGWFFVLVAAGGALLFAVRTGPLDGRADRSVRVKAASVDELSIHASKVAAELERRRELGMDQR